MFFVVGWIYVIFVVFLGCSGELVVFTVLCEKYQPSIQRDPSYSDYLVKIGQIFFGVPQQQQPRNQGLFGKFNTVCFMNFKDWKAGISFLSK